VTGPVKLKSITLKGKVSIANHTSRQAELASLLPADQKSLQNCVVEILRDGKIKIK